MTKIKICGITNEHDARYAAAAGAAALGLVFAKSPRRVTIAQARRIIDAVPPFVSMVGVFVNAPQREVLNVLKKCRLDVLQFHGQESNLYCAFFRTYCRIIKAFRIQDAQSITTAAGYPDVDAVLVDTFDRERYGGTGKRFSLDLVQEAGIEKPLIVAGGITPCNAGDVIRKVHPYALDVSSGAESAPGKKDPKKIRALFRSVQRASSKQD